jgi:hypothetical protein
VDCVFCDWLTRGDLVAANEVAVAFPDAFVPWARYPDDTLDNFVVADTKCNGFKSSSLAAAEHLTRWARRFVYGSSEYVQIGDLAKSAAWVRQPNRSQNVARAIYRRLPHDARLWLRKREFVPPDLEIIGKL